MKCGLPMLTAGAVASVMVLSVTAIGGLAPPAAAASTKCTYNAYDDWGKVFESISWKGKDTPKYNDGITKKYGQLLLLLTGARSDRSAARLDRADKGDRVWVNISHDKGKTWKSCGFKTADKDGSTIISKKFVHSGGTVKDRYMRACATTSGKTWCADIGNESNRNNADGQKRHWWTDS